MITPDSNRMVVDTEDAVSFSLTLATPVSRGMALVIDLAAISVIQSVINGAMMFASLLLRDVAVALIVVSYFVLSFGYFMLLEYAWNGQTLGKRIMQIRVIDAHVQRMTGYQVIIRNLFRVIDMLPFFYAVGGIVSLCNRRYQRLGDIAGSTIVIRVNKEDTPNIPNSAYNKYNSFRKYPHIEAILKRNSLPEEHALALQCVQRRDQLEATARVEIFHRVAEHFKEKAHFPAEITDDLSDEQYLRNCVDSIFRKR